MFDLSNKNSRARMRIAAIQSASETGGATTIPSHLPCRSAGVIRVHHRPALPQFLPTTGRCYGSGSTVFFERKNKNKKKQQKNNDNNNKNTVSTPLVVEAWARVLSQHSDRAFARYAPG